MWTPTGWQWLPVALGTLLLYELVRLAVVGTLRRRMEAATDRFLREHRIPTDPFRYTHRLAVREMVLGDPGLAAAMAEQARAEDVPVYKVQQRVRGWLDEVVPHFNLLAYYRVGYALARLATYSVYHVRLDEDSLRRVKEKTPEGAAVVYVSNHRSNADFVVTGFMLSRSVQVSYAVGEWGRVWPLEKLFKSFGSYFVRRGEKDPLYHRTLQAYVQLITKQGVTQAAFPEGGLSRDGRLRPVKLGLLDAMVRTKLDPSFTRPLVFVPVGINFDRVLEDEVLVREARGEAPRRRGPGQKARRLLTLTGRMAVGVPANLLRFLARRMKKHGAVAIRFGEPLVFDDWYRGQKPFLDEPDRHRRWEALGPFANELMTRIGRTVPVTSVPLVCVALVRIGPERMGVGVERADLLLAMRQALQDLGDAGAPLAVEDPYTERTERRRRERPHDLEVVEGELSGAEDLRRLLSLALDVMERRRLLVGDGIRYRVPQDQWDLVRYYANSLHVHLEQEPDVPEAAKVATP